MLQLECRDNWTLEENATDPGDFSSLVSYVPNLSSLDLVNPGLSCEAHSALVKLLWLTARGWLICLSPKICS